MGETERDQERRRLAAFLGHEPSRAQADDGWPQPDSLAGWAEALAGFGRLAAGHVALALARQALKEWEQSFPVWSSGRHPYIRDFDLFDADPRGHLVEGLRSWLADPSSPYSPAYVERWEEATEVCMKQSAQGTIMKEELVMFPAARTIGLAARVPCSDSPLEDLLLELLRSFLTFFSARDTSDQARHRAILRATRDPQEPPSLGIVEAHVLPVVGPPVIDWALSAD